MVRVSNRHSPDAWRNEEWLKDFLAQQLLRGRVSLVLGAGVSMALGLPSWSDLISALHRLVKLPLVPGQNNEIAAEHLLFKGFNSDRIAFAEAIRKELYTLVNVDPSMVEKSALMQSIGAMVMSSSRGRVSNVVTLNFDNLLEEHLESRGFVVRSIDRLPCWADVGDVTVLHPHGLLPHDISVSISRGVVFTQHDYAKIVNQAADLWRQKVTEIFRSNTCLFIGLSGNDLNLLSLMQAAESEHCSKPDAFWGVRFAATNDPMAATWEGRGVLNFELSSHALLPRWLLDVCKRAAKSRVPA